MADKKFKENSTSFGVSGFTLAMVGIFTLILIGPFSLPIFITGLIFCWIQQKKNPTTLGKIGLIFNIIGIIGALISLYFFIQYVIQIMGQIQSGQISLG